MTVLLRGLYGSPGILQVYDSVPSIRGISQEDPGSFSVISSSVSVPFPTLTKEHWETQKSDFLLSVPTIIE